MSHEAMGRQGALVEIAWNELSQNVQLGINHCPPSFNKVCSLCCLSAASMVRCGYKGISNDTNFHSLRFRIHCR